MKYLKIIFQQTLLITFGITFAIALGGLVDHFLSGDMYINWYTPASAIAGGFVCAVPSTLLLHDMFEMSRKKLIIRIIIHCIILYAVNSLMGWLFKWYTTPRGFFFVSISYFIVYIFAWAGSFLINRQEDKEINEALNDIRDEE